MANPETVPAASAVTEHLAPMSDGVSLHYRAWLPAEPVRQALLLFHRGHEHGGRWAETVAGLRLPGLAIFAWDARGHGQSPGPRGSAENLARLVQDVDEFVAHLCQTHGLAHQDLLVLAHSVGAVVATAWVHDYAPPIRALILAAPAFRVKLYIPLAIPALRLKQSWLGPGFVSSYVKAKMLTHDPEQARLYQADPAIFRQIAVNILLDLHDTGARLVADAGALTVPTLLLVAGADWVVDQGVQRRFFAGLSSPVKELAEFPDFYHAMFHERGREELVARIRRFIEERLAAPPAPVSLLQADRQGYTYEEYTRLRQPGGAAFGLVRLAMRTVGRLSQGIALGWRAGFDSGVTLDYVYENRPRGCTPLGTLIDHNYLNSIGWRGIRQRRQHLQAALRRLIERTHAAGQPVVVLDIAAGAGRYVLETLHQTPIPVTAVLRDYQEQNLAAARQLAEALGVTGVSIVQGDAFDQASLAAVQPRPSIAIASGLYELFPDNAPVQRSLAGLAQALPPGGHLIYTCQPWHPQVEFIARVLTNREGQPWIMRRRTQGEMDELVRAAGFVKVSQAIDPWGIFTVAVARRVAP